MQERPPASVYADRRMAALVGLGFASGLPNVLAGDTIAAWLSAVGIDVEKIGLLSLIGLPYALKFLWAPVMDRFAVPGLAALGRRRSWLLPLQVLLALLLAAIAFAGPASPADSLTPLLVLGTALVFVSASQDIVADAYRTDIAAGRDVGAAAAVFVSGYRIATVVGGGAALILARHFGWRAAIAAMAGLMAMTAFITACAPEPPEPEGRPQTFAEAIVAPLRHFIERHGWNAALIAIFVLVFRLPDLLASKMTMPLLIQGLGFTSEDVGWIRQVLGFFITIIGAIVGGGLIARFGMMRSLIAFGILQTASNAGFYLLAVSPPHLWTMALAIAVESFCGGLVAAGFVAFLMSCCDRRYSATQYAMLAGLMAAAQHLGGALTGVLVKHIGYASFFALTIAIGLPGIAMLPLMRRVRIEPAAC